MLFMLNKFRDRHAKRIIWVLAVVIIAAFGLSGAGFYLSGREKNTLGQIAGRKITASELEKAIRMAQLQVLLSGDNSQTLTRLDFERIGLDFLTLLWKADQEKITVNDTEVKDYIIKNILGRKKFNQENYQNFLHTISRRYNLGLNARMFEEYIRSFVKIDKLFKKHTPITVKPEEIKELYRRDTQKAKIAYLAVPYEKFKVEIGITPKEIEEFYKDNKALFKKDTAGELPEIPALHLIEAEVKEKLILEKAIKETKSFCRELVEKINSQNIKNLKKLAAQEKIEYKEPGYFKFYDYIEGLGLDPEISAAVFALKKDEVDPRVFTRENSAYIIQLKDLTSVDEKGFQEKKASYQKLISRNKQITKRMQFLQRLKQEVNLNLKPETPK